MNFSFAPQESTLTTDAHTHSQQSLQRPTAPPRRAARAAWRRGVDAGQDMLGCRGTLPWDGRDGIGGKSACSAKFGRNLLW